MGAMSRTKGHAGEREAAALLYELTGHHIKRRVRQHDGDSDLEGLPGWAVEVKRYASTPLALVAGQWWPQAAEQASRVGLLPVLLYRPDRGNWRAVWPAGLHLAEQPCPVSFGHTLTADPLTWWRMVRGLHHTAVTLSQPPGPTRQAHWANG